LLVLGIDIGGNQIRAGMVDEKGAVLASRTIPTPNDLDSFLPSLQGVIRWLMEATTVPAGVGVGCKGLIDPDSTRIVTLPGALHFPQGLRIVDMVGCPRRVPVFADNDARVALAGKWCGRGAGLSDVPMLTLGNGVGGAAMTNGCLLRGHSGMAGHMGPSRWNRRPGLLLWHRGCLETVFSARAIESELWAAVHRGCPSVLTRLFRAQPQLATCRTIFQAASEGDDPATAIVTQAFTNSARPWPGCRIFDPSWRILEGTGDAGADLWSLCSGGVGRSRACLAAKCRSWNSGWRQIVIVGAAVWSWRRGHEHRGLAHPRSPSLRTGIRRLRSPNLGIVVQPEPVNRRPRCSRRRSPARDFRSLATSSVHHHGRNVRHADRFPERVEAAHSTLHGDISGRIRQPPFLS
jgi:glucokinase